MSVASEAERLMLALINQDRAAAGLAPLTLELDLNEAAEDHSTWMLDQDVFSHAGSGGSSAGDRIGDAGFRLTGSWGWGENIAWQTERGAPGIEDDVRDLHAGLMASPSHRANILSPDFDHIGIGIEIGDFGGREAVMVTQNFARTAAETRPDLGVPEPEAPEPPPPAPEPPGEPVAEVEPPAPAPEPSEPEPAEEPVAEVDPPAPVPDPSEPEPVKEPVAEVEPPAPEPGKPDCDPWPELVGKDGAPDWPFAEIDLVADVIRMVESRLSEVWERIERERDAVDLDELDLRDADDFDFGAGCGGYEPDDAPSFDVAAFFEDVLSDIRCDHDDTVLV